MSKPGWKNKPNRKITVSPDHFRGKNEFDVARFETAIEQHGVRVSVYRSMECPNIKDIDSKMHNIDCDLCNGSGIIDVRPIETWALITNQDLNIILSNTGKIDGNTILATFPLGIELQYFTLVKICGIPDIFYQRVKRQSGRVDFLKYPALQVNAVVDSNGKEYFEGNDFCIDVNKNIKWKENRGPAKNTIYSIHYNSELQFRATKALHVNRFVQIRASETEAEIIRAPEQWLLTREFLVKRTDLNGDVLADQKIEDQ